MADGVKKSKVGNLGRVVALLDQHAADFGDFVTSDTQGKNLPGYLRQLYDRLVKEQATILTEMTALRDNIDHIKDIVAMQQEYAKVAVVTEVRKVSDLVEDSLQMNAAALTRHGVTVVRIPGGRSVVSGRGIPKSLRGPGTASATSTFVNQLLRGTTTFL